MAGIAVTISPVCRPALTAALAMSPLDDQPPHNAMIGHFILVPDHFTDYRVEACANVMCGEAAVISKTWYCHGGKSR